MRQVELLVMQDVISFESYDRWLGDAVSRGAETCTPMDHYIIDVCDDNGYYPTGGDMVELRGELLFQLEQYSALLYAYYQEVGVYSVEAADAVSIMATLALDMDNDLGVI